MADPIIRLKRSAVAGKRPTLANLPLGEVALNTYDGRLFVRQDTGGVGIATTIRAVNPWSENFISGGEHSIYYDGGDVGIGSQNPTSTLDVNGTVTATSFVGDGSQLTGLIAGIGIQSGSTRIGTGFTDIKFVGSGVSSIVGSGDTVSINIPATATTIVRQVETATGVTTVFTITDGYTAGFIDVYLNGVKQRVGTDFTATNGTTVSMIPFINDGDVLEFQIYKNLSMGECIGIGSTSILYNGSTVRVEATDYGSLTTGISSATNVSIGNTFTYPEYITGGMVPRAIKSQGGYDRTSGFADYQTGTEASQDPADYIEYPQELADSNTWKRFGITTAGNQARDGQWWGETNPNYDQSKGLFGGLTAPAGVDHFFDFSENTAFNNAQTSGSLKYTQALGSFSLKDCQVGDLVLARFDFNVMPMVTNTTLEVALIYANRDANDNITFTFPLTITPFTYGSGTVGKGFLLRPTITAYMANQQDVNSRSLVAIKADNPVLVNPIGVLFTIQR